MARPMVIDETVRRRVAEVIRHAERNPIGLLRMHRIARGEEVIPSAFVRDLFVEIPVGFGAVLTVEEHPCGWMRHLSLCVREPGRFPHPAAVAEVMGLFGFTTPFAALAKNCVYMTPGASGKVGDSVNVLEPWTPPPR